MDRGPQLAEHLFAELFILRFLDGDWKWLLQNIDFVFQQPLLSMLIGWLCS